MLAHSMGTRITISALRGAGSAAIGNLLLAAADVGSKEFGEALQDIRSEQCPLTCALELTCRACIVLVPREHRLVTASLHSRHVLPVLPGTRLTAYGNARDMALWASYILHQSEGHRVGQCITGGAWEREIEWLDCSG